MSDDRPLLADHDSVRRIEFKKRGVSFFNISETERRNSNGKGTENRAEWKKNYVWQNGLKGCNKKKEVV